MPAAPFPDCEADRQRALDRYGVLDTPPERAYDDLLNILSGICNVPMAAVSLVDHNRQWFKARKGIAERELPRDDAFCAYTILSPQELLVVEDAHQDPRFIDNPLVTGTMGLRFYAGAPLVDPDGHAVGSLCVLDQVPHHLSGFQREALKSLAYQVSLLLNLHRTARELRHQLAERDWFEAQLRDQQSSLEAQNAALTQQSRTDPLTGLANRRAFSAGLDHAMAQAIHDKTTLAMAVIDLDHFKRINDTCGHPTGDQVLMAVADRLRALAEAEQPAMAARWGGEEFVLLLPRRSLPEALAVCEEFRQSLPELNCGTPEPVRVSIGLTVWDPEDTSESLYHRADQALYQAKASGRDRVVAG